MNVAVPPPEIYPTIASSKRCIFIIFITQPNATVSPVHWKLLQQLKFQKIRNAKSFLLKLKEMHQKFSLPTVLFSLGEICLSSSLCGSAPFQDTAYILKNIFWSILSHYFASGFLCTKINYIFILKICFRVFSKVAPLPTHPFMVSLSPSTPPQHPWSKTGSEVGSGCVGLSTPSHIVHSTPVT